MALTKVQNTGIADDAVTTDKIENSTVLAADIAPGTITNAKLSNSALTLNGSSVSLGGSATLKHIEWQSLVVADGSTQLTAVAGRGYFLDTNTGVIEAVLPSSPSRGDTFVFADYGGTFSTNQLIINAGGQLIDSTTGPDFKVTTNNAIVELVYVDANKGYLVKLNQAAGTTPDAILTGNYDNQFIVATGGTITTSGDYKIHTFTGDGNFIVSCTAGAAANNEVSYIVVAGGAGGGAGSPNWTMGGGGGAGGFRESKSGVDSYTASPLEGASNITVTATTFPITVGGGGAGGSPPCTGQRGASGSNSVFSTITSAGGGGGGGYSGPNTQTANTGGSGGGGGNACGSPGIPGAAGNTPPVSPSQGSAGGNANRAFAGPNYYQNFAGGGGGATATGGNGGPTSNCGTGGAGGAGATTHITGSPVVYSGGGGGGGAGVNNNPGSASPISGRGGDGGSGGGGNGMTVGRTHPCHSIPWSTSSTGGAGTANTGGGGGGGGANGDNNSPEFGRPGGAGGKGIVIIRYKFQ